MGSKALPCCIEAPPSYLAKAQYALRMLLLPLGIEPVWVQRGSLGSEGIYYGSSSEQSGTGIIHMPLHEETIHYFTKCERYPVENANWRFWENERWPVLFGGPDEESDDLVASAFFWLSGWQEYTAPERDLHGRFPFDASLQSEWSLAHHPVVDAYRERLAAYLHEQGITFERRSWHGNTWAFCPTHDIDYLKKWRPGMVFRESVHYLLANRLRVSMGKRIVRFCRFLLDWIRPGDAFRKSLVRIIQETERVEGKGTYFFKADAHGPNDVFYALTSSFVRKVLIRLAKNEYEVGLHPSYFAYNHPGYFREEKRLLESVVNEPITSVRQHYLRYDAAVTPHLHVGEGFHIDSSLAFAEHEGFRRGTCHPFKIFDIEANQEMDLWEMPLCVMDGALFNRQEYTLHEAVEATRQLISRCRRFGGVCVALWHNTLWDELDFPGWGAHFVQIMQHAKEEGASIDSLQSNLHGYLTSGT